jgi:FAD:protein FMN transferase
MAVLHASCKLKLFENMVCFMSNFSNNKWKSAICFLCFAVWLSACQPAKKTGTIYALGGIPVNIITVGLNDDSLDRITQIAKISIEEWESELSMFRSESVVNQLAQKAGEPVFFSSYAWEALQLAIQAETVTDRAFDVTVGPVIRMWRHAEQNNTLPNEQQIRQALSYTSFEQLVLDDKNRSVYLKVLETESLSEFQSRFVLDFGGIAKGLFSEWLSRSLYDSLSANEKSRLEKLLVDIGGDMYVKSMSDEKPCRIGIRNPFDPTALWGIIELVHGATVTSGTYERFFEIDGTRYCHIVNPETGWPIETDLVSATIVDPSGAIADALATAVFVMGEEKAIDLINSLPQTEMVLIRSNGTHYVTEGLKHKLDIL